MASTNKGRPELDGRSRRERPAVHESQSRLWENVGRSRGLKLDAALP